VTLELRSARSLTLGERAELFNAAYDGYLVPFHVDERQLAFMDDVFDRDLDASRIAFRDGEPVGLRNLGLRSEDAWIGGVGVVPSARRAGVGESLMRALHEEARDRSVRRVWLEVIVENTGAFALYEKLGYVLVQDVEVWTLPAAEGGHAGREVPVAEAKAQLPERHEPWQRADGTLPLRRRARAGHGQRRDALLPPLKRAPAAVRGRLGASAPGAPHLHGRLRAQPPGGRSGGNKCSVSSAARS
jgi:GNAT superfamily N-acetyltransferase